MSEFRIEITTGSRTPIYRQIVDQVRLAAATGALPAGYAMPSVRILAEELLVNANTIVKAYAELAREGVLESHQGKGFFVAAKRQVYSRAERTRRLQQALDSFIHQVAFLDFSADEICKAVAERLQDLHAQLDSVRARA